MWPAARGHGWGFQANGVKGGRRRLIKKHFTPCMYLRSNPQTLTWLWEAQRGPYPVHPHLPLHHEGSHNPSPTPAQAYTCTQRETHSDFLLLHPIKAAVSPEPDERLTQMRKHLQRFERSPEDLDFHRCLVDFKSDQIAGCSLYLQVCEGSGPIRTSLLIQKMKTWNS